MAVARIIGGHLVAEKNFAEAIRTLRKSQSSLNTGSVLLAGKNADLAAISAFDHSISAPGGWRPTPIAPGGPLTIKILHVYTGKYPQNAWDRMAIFSAVKDAYVYKAAARSINYLAKNIKKRSLCPLSANEEGTNIVAYLPGLASDEVTVTIEMAFDDFPDKLFEKVASAAGDLSKLPILAPKAGYLILAGQLINLGGSLLNAIDSKAELSYTETLNFDLVNGPVTAADIRLIYNNDANFDDCEFDWKKGLVRKADKQPYNGDFPYIIVLIDGGKRDGLKGFAPNAASADVLHSFLDIKPDGSASSSVDAIVQLVTLGNDYRYFSDAKRIKDVELAKTDLSDEDRKKAKQKYNALIKNIQDTKTFKLDSLL